MAPHIDAFAPSRTKQSHESTEASKPGTQETTCPKGYSRFLQLQPEQNQRRNSFKPGKTSIHGIGKEINFWRKTGVAVRACAASLRQSFPWLGLRRNRMVLNLLGPNTHWSLACRCKIPAENFIAFGLLPDCRLQAGHRKPMILLATEVWNPASWRPSSNRCGKWRAAKADNSLQQYFRSLSPISNSFTSLMSPYLTMGNVLLFWNSNPQKRDS